MKKPNRLNVNDRNNKIVKFTLKKGKNTSGSSHYRVTGTIHKEHIDKKFKSRWEAEHYIDKIRKDEDAARSSQNSVTTTLTQSQINDATAAFDKIPKGISLSTIIDFYNEHKPQEEKTVKYAYEHYVAEQERIGRSINTVREVKTIMRNFVKSCHHMDTSEIKENDLIKFIQKGKVAPQTQNNRHKVYHKFFNYCLKRGWVSKNPAVNYEKIKIVQNSAKFFSPADAKVIIETTALKEHNLLLPYVTLLLFCGLRNSEASKLSWDKIRFDNESVSVMIDASIAKTNSKRFITLQENAAQLLTYCKKQNLTNIYPKNFRKRFDKLKEATALMWSSNILRHTFGTYRYAHSESADITAKDMGNSPLILKKYYDGLATKKEAEEFFSLSIEASPEYGPE